jgi:hypothetical protein
MSADRILYCLERVSDYRDFERLCSALLAGTDYPGIDPLGGTGDGGRDAIVRTDSSGRRVVFAYTVRGDWDTKLKSDCRRVKELAHSLRREPLQLLVTRALRRSGREGFIRASLQLRGGAGLAPSVEAEGCSPSKLRWFLE